MGFGFRVGYGSVRVRVRVAIVRLTDPVATLQPSPPDIRFRLFRSRALRPHPASHRAPALTPPVPPPPPPPPLATRDSLPSAAREVPLPLPATRPVAPYPGSPPAALPAPDRPTLWRRGVGSGGRSLVYFWTRRWSGGLATCDRAVGPEAKHAHPHSGTVWTHHLMAASLPQWHDRRKLPSLSRWHDRGKLPSPPSGHARGVLPPRRYLTGVLHGELRFLQPSRGWPFSRLHNGHCDAGGASHGGAL